VKRINNKDKENSAGNVHIDENIRINKKSGGICMMMDGSVGNKPYSIDS
jgi:hypothetical protein